MNQKLMSSEEFKKTPLYSSFLSENPSVGELKIQVFTAYKAIPIANADVLITKTIGDNQVVFFRGVTNSSGIIDHILLPAPMNASETSLDVPKYTLYDLTVIHIDYETIKKYVVAMFGDTKVIQYVRMTPQIELKGVEQNGN